MDISVDAKDLDLLINPYLSKDDLLKVWKEYIMFKRGGRVESLPTHRDIDTLAKNIVQNFDIAPESISCLFRRGIVRNDTPPPPEYRINFKPADMNLITPYRDPEVDFVTPLQSRFTFPEDKDPEAFGPNNADELASNISPWCHELVRWGEIDTLINPDEPYNHAMLKCTCYQDITPEFKCPGCKGAFSLNSKCFFRLPKVKGEHGGLGGWGKFYCSTDCIVKSQGDNLSEIQMMLLEYLKSCIGPVELTHDSPGLIRDKRD